MSEHVLLSRIGRRAFLAALLALPAGCAGLATQSSPVSPVALPGATEPPRPAPTSTPQPTSTAPPPTIPSAPTETVAPPPAPTTSPPPATATIPPLPTAAIVQPNEATPRAWMDYAARMRQQAVDSGDQSFGAIIVKDNRVVGLGPSRVVVNGDPTAHAEIEAIRDACRRLGTRDLSGCVMVSTSKPCRMCETAAYWARIARLVYGVDLADGGAPRYDNC